MILGGDVVGGGYWHPLSRAVLRLTVAGTMRGLIGVEKNGGIPPPFYGSDHAAIQTGVIVEPFRRT